MGQFGQTFGQASQQNYDTRLQFQGNSIALPRIVVTQLGNQVADSRFKFYHNNSNDGAYFDVALLDETPLGTGYQSSKILKQVINTNRRFILSPTNDNFTITRQELADEPVVFQ